MSARTKIKQMYAVQDGWVRIVSIRRLSHGLELVCAIHRGKRGPLVETWVVRCTGVRESHICDLDGGGISLYPSSHPAARQYIDARAELRFEAVADPDRVLAALLRAHVILTDDWIPFDRYINEDLCRASEVPRGKLVLCGPNFLMRGYAMALRRLGVSVRVLLKGQRKGCERPGVLHFGESYIVADGFSVQEVQGVVVQQAVATGKSLCRSSGSARI